MADRKINIPAIPEIPAGLSSDLRLFLETIKERVEMREGRFGSDERNITERDMRYAGFDPGYFTPGTPEFTVPDNEETPEPPTNLALTQAGLANYLTWDQPTGDTDDISHISVFVSINSSDRSNAYELATVDFDPDDPSAKYTHQPLSAGTTYYYWIRSVTYGGKYSTWEPTSGQGPIVAPSYETIPELLGQLADDSSKYVLSYRVIADSFEIIQPSNLINAYDSGATYSVDDLVEYGGSYFKSLFGSNTNNTPESIAAYVALTTYIIGDKVRLVDEYYESLQNSNTGNDPATEPTWWDDITATVYWEDVTASIDYGQTVFQLGKIGDVTTLGLRGDMIIDGTVYANAIHAGQVSAEKMVAHDLVAWSIKGNYSAGLSGFLLDSDPLSPTFGLVEFNQMTMVLNWATDVSGTGIPETGATLGATWGTDISDPAGTMPEDNATLGATTAQVTDISTANTNATAALDQQIDIAADGIFSIQEKNTWRIQWPGMLANHDSIITQATTYDLSAHATITGFTAAKDDLYAYLDTTHDIWAATPADTTITGTDLIDKTELFYSTMQDSVQLIADTSPQYNVDNTIDTDVGGYIARSTTTGDYAHLTDADLVHYYNQTQDPNNLDLVQYSAITRIEINENPVPNGTLVTLPGIWKEEPKIRITSRDTELFNPGFDTQPQRLLCYADNIQETSAGSMVYQFSPVVELIVGAASVNVPVNYSSGVDEGYSLAPVLYLSSKSSTLWTNPTTIPNNTSSISVPCKVWGYWVNDYGSGSDFSSYTVTVNLEFWVGVNGNSAIKRSTTQVVPTSNASITRTLSYSTSGEITSFYVKIVYVTFNWKSHTDLYGGSRTSFSIGSFTSTLPSDQWIADGLSDYLAVGR